jgi:hypothetical protein
LRSKLTFWRRPIAVFALCFIALAFTVGRAPAEPGPFSTLLGTWGGSGEYSLTDGTRERLKCNAWYTGGGAQLGMSIRCTGGNNKIEIRSKLNNSGGRLSGHWEERTYNAEGDAIGTATDNRIVLQISGAVTGTMSVDFSGSTQTVSISTQGTSLRGVNITLGKS